MIDIQRTIRLILGALFDAADTWRAYRPDSGDWRRTAVLITIPVIVMSMLVAWLLGLVTGGSALFGVRPTLVQTLMAIVSGLLGLALAAFIFSYLAGMFGGRHDFARAFAALSLAYVPAAVGQALSSLPLIGWLLSLGLAIYSLVLLWQIIPLYLDVPGDKRVLHYIASLLATFVAGLVLSLVLGGGQMDRPPNVSIGAGKPELPVATTRHLVQPFLAGEFVDLRRGA